MLRPSHVHTAFTATILLMASTFLSRIIGLVRMKYIVWLFGKDMQADALNAAFVLPDMISYFLVGGAASITFVTILTRYRETGREAEGQRSLSVILTTMYLVLGGAIVVAELIAPWFVHWMYPLFGAEKAALCVLLTRILLPAQLCFFAGGIFGAVLLVRKQFSVQAVTPLIYGMGTIVGGLLLVRRIGVSSLALGTVAGAFLGPFLLNWIFARRAGTRYHPILDWHDEGLRDWVRLSLPLMAGISLVTADNWIILHFASATNGEVSLMSYAKQLFTAPMAILAQAAGAASMPFFATARWIPPDSYCRKSQCKQRKSVGRRIPEKMREEQIFQGGFRSNAGCYGKNRPECKLEIAIEFEADEDQHECRCQRPCTSCRQQRERDRDVHTRHGARLRCRDSGRTSRIVMAADARNRYQK